MRSFLVGLGTVLLLALGASAQVTGFVESVGIAGRIRPDCWNPARVNLTSTVSDPMQYELQVWQEDLDKDRVVYTRPITLSSHAQEKFDVYFVPEPSLGDSIISPGVLQKSVKIKVCLPRAENSKPDDAKVVIEQLPVNFAVQSLDPRRSPSEWSTPGVRLVLYITDGSSAPAFKEYQDSPGLVEYVDAVGVHPSDLGENVLYYDAVDTVIWLSGNADELEASGSHRKNALEAFVRQGGRLVVCQGASDGARHRTEALAPMLPIETKDASGNWLITLSEKAQFVDEAKAGGPSIDALPWLSQDLGRYHNQQQWHNINADGKHPIRIARATPRPDARVEVWQNWSAKDRSPYIVRGSLGLGCVTWVAQDLGDISLTGPQSSGWPHIWDHIIGWKNDTALPYDASSAKAFDDMKAKRANKTGDVDLSQWMLQGTDNPGKAAAYVVLAFLFFVGYGIAAGPGTYLYLSRKKRKDLNWFIFGAWAFVGTALTVLLVKLLLRGGPEVHHLSVIRQNVGEPTYVYSRLGLYIPRDGDRAITIDDPSQTTIDYLTPLQIHPQYYQVTQFPASQLYGVPVTDDPAPVTVRVPFRSTAKKLQARWVGEAPATIGGAAKLIASNVGGADSGVISGTLINQTGVDLRNVYLVFTYRGRGQDIAQDRVLFLHAWGAGKKIDLNDHYAHAKNILIGDAVSSDMADPRGSASTIDIKGPIDNGWGQYWTRWTSTGIGGVDPDHESRAIADFGEGVPKGFPVLSLFDRIMPARNNDPEERADFVRRGGTILNMSSAVAGGKLVILAQSATDMQPIPMPMTVEGTKVQGEGRVLYQFSLPLDAGEMEADAARHD